MNRSCKSLKKGHRNTTNSPLIRFPVGLKLADIVFYMSDIDIYNILTDSNTNDDMIRIIQKNIWQTGETMQDMILGKHINTGLSIKHHIFMTI